MKSGKPNWVKIRTEYETTETSYKKLSEKYGVSLNTLKPRAVREKWTKRKEKTHTKIALKTHQKIIEKISDNISNDFAKELEASELLNDLILETLRDTKQFKKHLVQTKSKSGDIHTGIDESWDVEEKEFTVVDTKRLKDLASTLTANSGLRQTLKGFIPAATREKLDIEKESLEIAKNKSGLNDDDSETGIVNMPSIDLERYEKEKAEELERRTKKDE